MKTFFLIHITFILSSTLEGNTTGLNDKDIGQIGIIVILYTEFCIIGPPADKQ
jgi:hypothetical protein